MTILSLADWLNFSIASIEDEKTFIGSGPGPEIIRNFEDAGYVKL